MSEKEMHPKPEADTSEESKLKGRPKPGTRSGGPPGDARGDEEQLRRNQDELGVGPDHKTEDMEKHRRGTFP